MYKTIIVPLDGSPFAEHAIATAAEIAKCSAAELVLVRVHEAFAYESTDHSLLGDLSRRDQEEYVALIAERVEMAHGVSPERALLDGPVAATICDFAAAMEAPLIVMSTHGRTGFSRLWLGSIADVIMRHAPMPILMLRHHNEPVAAGEPPAHRLKKVLVPLDGSDGAELALAHAQALAVAFAMRLVLFRVVAPIAAPVPLYAVPYAPSPIDEDMLEVRVEDAEGYVDSLRQRLQVEEPALKIATEVRVSDTPAVAILDAAHRHDVDTVAIATHGRGISRVVIASVADKILRAGPDAVLVVREGAS